MGCGLGAVTAYGEDVDVAYTLYTLAQSQNNRGDESTGFGFYTGDADVYEQIEDDRYSEARDGLALVKYEGGVGTETYTDVNEQFGDAATGIVHDRYATSGTSDLEHAQPFIIDGEQTLLVGHNGNIANHEALRDRYADEFDFATESDTEVIGRILAGHDDVADGIRTLEDEADGAFNLTILDEDGALYAYRDSLGQHPLHYGITHDEDGDPDAVVVASEDFAANAAAAYDVEEINPGELVTVTDVIDTDQLVEPDKQFCPFEVYYFENPGSSYRDRRIQDIREDIGFYEGLDEPLADEDAIVVPVLSSGGAFAEGYADAADLPLRDWLVRNRQSRNYMIPAERDPDQEMTREQTASLKHVPLPEVADERIVFVDDSVVRGSTSTAITRDAYAAGADEVHWRIMFPKITNPCVYGLDHSERDNLIAVADDGSVRTDEAIADAIGADSIRFGRKEAFEQVTGDTTNCWACVDGDYPTDIPETLDQSKPDDQ